MFELVAQIVSLPLIVAGELGAVFVVTANVWAIDEPQELFAVTVMLPPVVLATAEREFVVEVPIQPPGKVQV